MQNQEIFIVVIVVVLVIIYFTKWSENFESDTNYYPCQNNPKNSNCTCPSQAPVQRVLGQFPMNYGDNSPYTYTCVPNTAQEPPTNVYPNPPE